jgi:hypothetical protein
MASPKDCTVRLGLIFSNDWELFGDGSGEYFELQHRPLEALLKVVHERGAKLTVMAEVAQQFAHQALAERQSWAHEIAEAWEGILRDTVKMGSDVQLHLHPQWLGATHENNRWVLDLSKWAVSSITPDELERVFRDCKAYLEGLLKPIDPEYACIAFRAGAYCIQPSKHVVEKLKKVGVLSDSSVVAGLYKPPFNDFRFAVSNIVPWFADANDVQYKDLDSSDLLEIPLCTFTGFDLPFLRRYVSKGLSDLICFGTRTSDEDERWQRQRRRLVDERYPASNRPFKRNKLLTGSLYDQLKRMRGVLGKAVGARRAFPLDYDQLPSKIFVSCIRRIYESAPLKPFRDNDVTVPMMVTGHVKNMQNCDNISRIFDEIDGSLKGRVVYWTFRDAVRYWLSLTSRSQTLAA